LIILDRGRSGWGLTTQLLDWADTDAAMAARERVADRIDILVARLSDGPYIAFAP